MMPRKSMHPPFFPTSVKTGTGLDAIFNYITTVERRGHAPTDEEMDTPPATPAEQGAFNLGADGHSQ